MEFFLFILMNTNSGLKKFYLVSSKRAKEIFVALDTNGDGAITEDEFVRLGSGFSGVRIYQILQVPRYLWKIWKKDRQT